MKRNNLLQHITMRSIGKTLCALPTIVRNTWYHWRNARLDRKYGIDTQGIIDDMDALAAPITVRQHASGYEGVQISVFKCLLNDLRVNPHEYTFIDFGSGKGRACIMAAERGFTRVIGVEFSPVLHAIAQQNMSIFQQRHISNSAIELHLQDATTFSIPDGKLVCFFYNPFDETVLEKVLNNIHHAFLRYQKPITIAYRNAVHAPMVESRTELSLTCATNDYHLYQLRGN